MLLLTENDLNRFYQTKGYLEYMNLAIEKITRETLAHQEDDDSTSEYRIIDFRGNIMEPHEDWPDIDISSELEDYDED